MERIRPAPLTAEETELVLRRAAQLGRASATQPLADAAEPSLELAELEKIGLESGMSREAIQRAYLELRTGKLAPQAAETLAARWLGAASISAERPLAMMPEETSRALERALEAELLHAAEQDGEKIVWAQAPGVWAALRRGFKGHQTWKNATLISEVKMAPAGLDAQSVLTLEAELEGRLAPLFAAFGFSLAPAFVTVALLTQQMPGMGLFFAGVTAGVAAIAFTGFRSRYLRRLRELRLGVTRVLDRVGRS